jgi:hypothetical protein
MDSRRSTAVQFFVEDDNNKVSCTSVASCVSEVTWRRVSVVSIFQVNRERSLSNASDISSRLL